MYAPFFSYSYDALSIYSRLCAEQARMQLFRSVQLWLFVTDGEAHCTYQLNQSYDKGFQAKEQTSRQIELPVELAPEAFVSILQTHPMIRLDKNP